jgi:glutamate-1-semialdehyde aminotransferase
VFDEVTSGWRVNTGGIHLTYGVRPDIAVFAKGMSNGYAMAAIVGIGAVMEAAQSSFISSTYWTERIGPAAAIAAIKKHRARNVGAHLVEVGTNVQAGWRRAAERAGLTIHVDGLLPLSHFGIKHDKSAAAHTLFTQLMLDQGFLASGQVYASLAHEPRHVEAYLGACNEAFGEIARALAEGTVEKKLRGPVKHAGFQRLT